MRMKIDNDGTDSLAMIAIIDLKLRCHLAANMFPVSGCKSAGTGCSDSCLLLYLARQFDSFYIFTYLQCIDYNDVKMTSVLDVDNLGF